MYAGIAQIENDAIIDYPVMDLRHRFPHTSFPDPLTPDDMPEGYVAVAYGERPYFNPQNQKLVEADPVLLSGTWTQKWEIVDVPPTVPTMLTIRQARRVLLAAGLLDDVEAAVSAADRETQIDWECATEIKRDWPTLVTMSAALGMTDAQLDGLFIEGAKL